MKRLIWILGGMASGKSTLRDGLIRELKTSEPKLVKEEGVEYVDCGRLASLGNCLTNGQCNGLDQSFNRLKKEGAIKNVELLVKNYDTIILEGSQTSAQWILPLCEICLNNDCRFILLHLNLRLWANYMRLRDRVLKRGKDEYDITDKKLDNIRAKVNQTRSIRKKCELTEFIDVINVDSENFTSDQTLEFALKELKKYE